MELKFDQNNPNSLLADLPREQLEVIILQQAALIAQLQIKIGELEKEIQELKANPPSGAAPFGRNKNQLSKDRKKSGRKKGHQGFFRQPPEPTEIIEVALEFCPDCGAPVEQLKNHTQTIEELPIMTRQVIQIKTQSGYCRGCRKRIRSSHPLQVSRAKGAASTMLGPRAAAVLIDLQHRFQLTKSKTCALIKELFGLELTRGGLVNLSHRLASRLAPQYAQLEREVRDSSYIHADETGWYVGARGHQLCVFTNLRLTLYKIAASRNRELVKQILGHKYGGVLISDCLSIYDEVNARQQKCYAHHLRAIEAADHKMAARESRYLEELKRLLQTAMTLKTLQSELSAADFRTRLRHLENWAGQLLEAENLDHQLAPEEETVRRRLVKQRDHLFEFLKHKEVAATNNQAERQLRPAVIARKLSCGNRTPKGARTWEILASLAVTAKQRNQVFKDLIFNSMFSFSP